MIRIILFAIFISGYANGAFAELDFYSGKTPQFDERYKEIVFEETGEEIVKVSNLRGIMNNNFLVESAQGKKYVFKVFSKDADNIFSRTNEFDNQSKAASLNITPKLHLFSYNDSYLGLIEYITPSGKVDIEKDYKAIAKLISSLHTSSLLFDNTFDYVEIVNKFLEANDDNSILTPEDKIFIKEQNSLFIKLVSYMKLTNHVPSHNDLNIENFIISHKGLKLVDWEFSSMNDPAWDISYFLMINRVQKNLWQPFLDSYISYSGLKDEYFKDAVMLYRPFVLIEMALILNAKRQDNKLSVIKIDKVIRECLDGARDILSESVYNNIKKIEL